MKLSKIYLGVDGKKVINTIDFNNCKSSSNINELENEEIRLNFTKDGIDKHPIKWISFCLPINSDASHVAELLIEAGNKIKKYIK